jgi:hypothetical protein
VIAATTERAEYAFRPPLDDCCYGLALAGTVAGLVYQQLPLFYSLASAASQSGERASRARIRLRFVVAQ